MDTVAAPVIVVDTEKPLEQLYPCPRGPSGCDTAACWRSFGCGATAEFDPVPCTELEAEAEELARAEHPAIWPRLALNWQYTCPVAEAVTSVGGPPSPPSFGCHCLEAVPEVLAEAAALLRGMDGYWVSPWSYIGGLKASAVAPQEPVPPLHDRIELM